MKKPMSNKPKLKKAKNLVKLLQREGELPQPNKPKFNQSNLPLCEKCDEYNCECKPKEEGINQIGLKEVLTIIKNGETYICCEDKWYKEYKEEPKEKVKECDCPCHKADVICKCQCCGRNDFKPQNNEKWNFDKEWDKIITGKVGHGTGIIGDIRPDIKKLINNFRKQDLEKIIKYISNGKMWSKKKLLEYIKSLEI